MGRTLEQLLAEEKPEVISAATVLAEEMLLNIHLAELREKVNKTQNEMAQALGLKQPTVAGMEKAIALYRKSLDESAAAVEAENAKARALEAAEKAKTVAETESVSREKQLDALRAQMEAERTRLLADGEKVRHAVEAEAQRLINEARTC